MCGVINSQIHEMKSSVWRIITIVEVVDVLLSLLVDPETAGVDEESSEKDWLVALEFREVKTVA